MLLTVFLRQPDIADTNVMYHKIWSKGGGYVTHQVGCWSPGSISGR